MSEAKKFEDLAAVDDPLDPTDLEDIVGLSLSGGGFKAAAYHLGALVRINELGALPKIARYSSVSGGSITAGVLASRWRRLAFDPATGVAANFMDEVFQPLIRFCREAEIDVSAWLDGAISPFDRASDEVAEAYDKWLFDGATLLGLPNDKKGEGPRFTFNASNLQLNSLVRFAAIGVRDWRVGEWQDPGLTLARVVAASSAFPPILSPVIMTPPKSLKPYENSDRGYPPFTERLEMADGGIYDNLGLETIWKKCKTILVSNAGDPFNEMGNPPDDWLRQLRRTVSMIHRQAENHRMRMLIALAKLDYRVVALWNLRGHVPTPGLSASPEDAALARAAPVRLSKVNQTEGTALLRHGYSMANAAIKAFWLKDQPVATAFPPDLWA